MKQTFQLQVSLLAACVLLLIGSGCAHRAAAPQDNYYSGDYSSPTRIVVLPFYTEEGLDAGKGGDATLHYRRITRFINNQLARHGFEVISPFAREASEREYNRMMQRAREDSPLAAMEMCRKYGTDVAYIVWLTVRPDMSDKCRVSARIDGEGYDSAGRDLGAGVSKTFTETRNHCDDAIAEVEKNVGDVVGRTLTAWRGRSYDAAYGRKSPYDSRTGEGGVIKRRADRLENIINVRLDGATEYELSEVFGKVINTTTGVLEAKTYGSRIQPDNPQASYASWRVTMEDTDPFRFQTNVMKMINDILDGGGVVVLKGVPYRYSAGEVDLLMGIRPGSTTSREIQFVIDRERARDRIMQGIHDPYNAPAPRRTAPGFD